MAKWLLIDGYNIAYRSFFAIPELTRSDGFRTNAIHGFLRTVWKLEDQEKPDHIAVLYDSGEPTTRTKLLPTYKANREGIPHALSQQMPWIKKLTRALGYHLIEREGEEADDLIAAMAKKLKKEGNVVYIVSADKDLAQCIEPGVFQLLPPPPANAKAGWRLLNEAGVEEKFGVPPEKLVDYLSLIGDIADNIPGISGVGPKTAAKWIKTYGSVECVIQKANYLLPKRFQGIIQDNTELLRRNIQLIGLNSRLEIATHKPMSPDPNKLQAIFDDLEINKAGADARKRHRTD